MRPRGSELAQRFARELGSDDGDLRTRFEQERHAPFRNGAAADDQALAPLEVREKG